MMDGKVIVVTRAEEAQDGTASLVSKLGGIPYSFPTVGFKSAGNLAALERLSADMLRGDVDYLVFLSWNGFSYMMDASKRMKDRSIRRAMRNTTIVAVGPETAKRLRAAGLKVGVVAGDGGASGVVKRLKALGIAGSRVVIVRNMSAKDDTAARLRHLNATVREVYTYRTYMPYNQKATRRFISELSKGKIDAVVFGSPIAAENMIRVLGRQVSASRARGLLNGTTPAAIGRTTARKVRELGLRTPVVPKRHAFREMLNELSRRL